MKTKYFGYLFLASFGFSSSIFAQVEINKQVVLNGALAADKKITGLSDATSLTDAASANVVQKGKLNYSAGTLIGTNYTVTLSPALDVYQAGTIVHFKAGSNNAGSATLNVNSLGTRSILKNVSEQLAPGDIKSNQVVSVIYDGTNFQVLSPLPAKILYSRVAKVSSAGNSSYTASANDDIVGIDQLSGVPFTITLPPANVSGEFIVIKLEKQNTTTFPNLTIQRGGTDLIDNGAAPVTFANAGGNRRFYSDGAGNWYSW
jgi:hypothetical protein